MKSFILACLCTLFCTAVFAGEQTLPEPTLAQIVAPASAYGCEFMTPNDVATNRGQQQITGWSQDGTKLYAVTYGGLLCGCRGRGCLRPVSWCGTLTWTITVDPTTGALNPVETATFTAGNPACNQAQPGTFYNSFNYGATAVYTPSEFTPDIYFLIATLLTP